MVTFCGTPGLVVMSDDSRSKDRGFESLRIVEEHLDIFAH